jgi:CubicO group peptidase (beta-lactamase class C family)
LALAVCLAACGSAGQQPRTPPDDPTPHTVEEFQATATRILAETGVPGAGMALVRQDAVEWAGGVGYADRDARTPVTADTHFRVGSISKTFLAMSLVQLYEDGKIDLESPVEELDPAIAIDNPWKSTDPVRIVHVLQHTAGFDDMHFNDRYVADGAPEVSLDAALARNPGARRVRWRPGTRMAYSNVGYGVAGALLEKAAGEPYEDYIQHAIFDTLDMPTSSFRLTTADEPRLARGYTRPTGPPIGYPRIYLRPAGNLHTSPRELAQFVRMLLNWGEVGTTYVVDPEYLGNMEQPRTTLAAAAGLRNGYGSGISTVLTLPYRVLGHDGGIDGFTSTYGYSPSRDVGYVVLLNSVGERSAEAMTRLSSIAIRYLKRDVEPPATPEAKVDTAILDQYTGYYHDANPRNQLTWPIESLLAGRTITRDGHALSATPVIGPRVKLIPVTEKSFRLERELDASRVFTHDADGTLVMAGGGLYAERRPRWRVELVRVPTLASPLIVASVLVTALAWAAHSRRPRPRGFWGLKAALILCALLLFLIVAALNFTPARLWGDRTAGTLTVFVASLGLPVAGLLAARMAVLACRQGASRWLTSYAMLVVAAMTWICLYLGANGLLGLRLWNY